MPLALTVHAMHAPALGDERRTRLGRLKMIALLAVCAAPVVASYFTYYVIRPQSRTNYGELVEPRELPPRLPLATLAGDAVDPATLHGQWLLVAVAAAGCDEGCERRLLVQRQLREALGRDKGRVDKLWLIPGDGAPRAETAEALRRGDPVTLLRVPPAALAGWLQPAPGRGLDEHLYLVDPLGRWMLRWPADADPAKMKRDLDRLLRASASWDRAGR